MASRSDPDTSDSDSEFDWDEAAILVKEYDESVKMMNDNSEEVNEKKKQHDLVRSALNELSTMLMEKEIQLIKKKAVFVKMNEDEKMKIAEEKDDIKVLKEVIRMKEIEKKQRVRELEALFAIGIVYCKRVCKVSDKLSKIISESKKRKRDRKMKKREEAQISLDEGAAGSTGQAVGASND